MKFHPLHKNAFSLVELSIVLVILGLLVGGVLSGQSLIRAAELRAVTTEYNEIVTAAQQFRDKYFALPGDMTNATRFWLRQGGLGGYDASCISNSGAATNATTQQGACDGNGDGTIQLHNVLSVNENAQFWQHLKMAGLMNVKVPQTPGDGGIGINFNGRNSEHNSRFAQVHWTAFYYPPATGQSTGLSDARVGTNLHVLMFGSSAGNTQPNWTPVLNPEDAWNIDSKVDDGKSISGTIRATHIGVVFDGCLSGSDYALSDTRQQCSLVFVKPF